MRRVLLTASLTLGSLLLAAPAALAHDGGQGAYGETNDQVVTNTGFILIIFFPAFVLMMSLLQGRLEKRKYARQAAAKSRASSAQWRGGW